MADLKSHVDKLDINKLKNVPNGLSTLRRKVDKLDVHKLVLVPRDLIKLCDVVIMILLKKNYIMVRLKILKLKYVILITKLLMLVLMLK